tara:strand:+ start:1081 stop:1707 length:627 start_codon:yes stop_codon:yes gene_type:complete
MEKSIEKIWENGFLNEDLITPKIKSLYNQKSISLVESIINKFKKKVLILIPLGILFFIFNIILDNDNAIFWGIISAAPCFGWFLLGKKQLKAIKEIDYKSNSYDYLVSIQEKINHIRRFNKRLIITCVPLGFMPMLIYTYFNNQGKTIGEIFGVDGLNYPIIAIFSIIPILTIIAVLIDDFVFKINLKGKTLGIDSLIKEMEELNSKQ